MKILKRLLVILLSVVTAISLSSCMDLGVGEEEDSYTDYISSVILLSPKGRIRRSIKRFSEDISLEDSEIDDSVVPYMAYSYIGFRISNTKDVEVEEFALFAKTNSSDQDESFQLEFEFYVSDKMPTKLSGLFGGDDVYLPEEPNYSGNDDYDESALEEPPKDEEGNIVDRDGEVTEDDLSDKYFMDTMTISNDWSSVYCQFGSPQRVSRGDYIIIKFLNNCEIKGYETEDKNVEFTVNYLMFRFTYVSS